ncbi:MAG: LCP family protein, partial [Clostridiales bacterium]|nr:LCP family protein [Clostridiales bacterium]
MKKHLSPDSGRHTDTDQSDPKPSVEIREGPSITVARVSDSPAPGMSAKKFSRKKYFWLLALIPVVLVVAAVAVYAHFRDTYKKTVFVEQSYVDSWDQFTDPNFLPSTDSAGIVVTPPPEATPLPTPTDIPVEPPDLNDVDTRNDPIIKKERIDPAVENFLIIGIDGADVDNEGHRSDTMLIVSINGDTQKVKLVSIMRDIWTYFPNTNSWNKINASYAFGGPGQTVNIINENFDLDIQEYIVMDFSGYKDIIDLLGGVTVKLSAQEASQVPGIDGSGTYTLSGEQALAYSRIRKIDSDFMRVQRQRNVLLALFSGMRDED